MYIYHKQCDIMQNFNETAQTANFRKEPVFFPFSVSAPRNNVGGRRSDNFEATGRAHSSFGRFLPILFGEHIEIGITSETVGPRPA